MVESGSGLPNGVWVGILGFFCCLVVLNGYSGGVCVRYLASFNITLLSEGVFGEKQREEGCCCWIGVKNVAKIKKIQMGNCLPWRGNSLYAAVLFCYPSFRFHYTGSVS